jgi:hypothetical protein
MMIVSLGVKVQPIGKSFQPHFRPLRGSPFLATWSHFDHFQSGAILKRKRKALRLVFGSQWNLS